MTKHLDVPELSTRIVIISASRAETDQHYCFYKITPVFFKNKIDNFDPFLFRKNRNAVFRNLWPSPFTSIIVFSMQSAFPALYHLSTPSSAKRKESKTNECENTSLPDAIIMSEDCISSNKSCFVSNLNFNNLRSDKANSSFAGFWSFYFLIFK